MARRRFLRDVIGVFGSNVFSLINGFLISVVLTRVLGPEGFGIYTAILIIPFIVVSLTHLGIRGSSVYHVGKKTFDENDEKIPALGDRVSGNPVFFIYHCHWDL